MPSPATLLGRVLLPTLLGLGGLSAVEAPFAPGAGQPGSTAVAHDDPRLSAWATAVREVRYGDRVDAEWREPARALGPATGDVFDVLSLGEGGAVTLEFNPPLRDGPGPDLAIFENGVSDTFLELALVEISSDGTHFVRFPATSLTESPVESYGMVNPRAIDGLAGKYRAGFGTPFDLAVLRSAPGAERLDLEQVRFVRLLDVVGDGSTRDSAGRPIHDPYPTLGSAGFDLEAAGALDAVRAFLPDSFPVAAGWRWSAWLGYHYTDFLPWIASPRGWLYLAGPDPRSVFLYQPGVGWHWTSPALAPFVYDFSAATWRLWE